LADVKNLRDALSGIVPGSGVNTNPLCLLNPLTGNLATNASGLWSRAGSNATRGCQARADLGVRHPAFGNNDQEL
jgi:hypothetical protein